MTTPKKKRLGQVEQPDDEPSTAGALIDRDFDQVDDFVRWRWPERETDYET